MANLDSFDANSIMREIAKAAPILLLVAALASFFIVGVFCVDYYETLLKANFGAYSRPMAILLACIQELVRFGLLVSSIRDFSDKKRFNGWLGLLGSLALVWHDVNTANSIALQLSPENPLPYATMIIFAILVGFGLEIRLILTVDLKEEKLKTSTSKKTSTSNGVYTAVSN